MISIQRLVEMKNILFKWLNSGSDHIPLIKGKYEVTRAFQDVEKALSPVDKLQKEHEEKYMEKVDSELLKKVKDFLNRIDDPQIKTFLTGMIPTGMEQVSRYKDEYKVVGEGEWEKLLKTEVEFDPYWVQIKDLEGAKISTGELFLVRDCLKAD